MIAISHKRANKGFTIPRQQNTKPNHVYATHNPVRRQEDIVGLPLSSWGRLNSLLLTLLLKGSGHQKDGSNTTVWQVINLDESVNRLNQEVIQYLKKCMKTKQC